LNHLHACFENSDNIMLAPGVRLSSPIVCVFGVFDFV